MRLRDEGVSAFKGKHRENPDTHALASFLAAVKSGRVPAGSFLVVESLDRLSREKIRPALTLLLNLIEAGVKVVQLLPVEAVYDEDVEPMALLQAIMELNRGHSESKVKSERVGAAWARKRKEAAKRIVTRRLPGWVRLQDGKLILDKPAAKIVKRVYQMTRDGLGVHKIAETLNREGVPVLGRQTFKGRPVVWSETVVYHLLTTRTVIGEYQPCKGRGGRKTRQAVGEPVAGYYPAAVDPDLFYAVQAVLRGRAKVGHGRRGSHVNLFAGLLKDARDGGSLTYKHLRAKPSALIPVGAKHGRGVAWASFPAVPFERLVLSKLREVEARDLFPNGDAVHKVEALAGQVAEVEALIEKWTAKMNNPDIVDIVEAQLTKCREKQKALAAQLAEAQRAAASPPSEAWGETRSLMAVLDKARDKDEARLRLKTALRRTIEGMWCVFTGVGSARLAHVQVYFTGGRSREYLLYHSQARVGSPARSSVASWADKWGTSHERFTLKDNPRRAKQVQLALTPDKDSTPISPAEWDTLVSEDGEPYIPGINELIEAMRQAATPDGGSPDPEFIGPLVQEVLGRSGSAFICGRPAVE
jgi:DNA invertase Pin-like site-specific DNA recombinase